MRGHPIVSNFWSTLKGWPYMDNRNLTFPDFLGIGAQRAGTTWLSENLRQHPEIWMPPKKELHYFNRFYSSAPSLIIVDSLFLRLFGRQWDSRRWRRGVRGRLSKAWEERDWRRMRWELHFLFGRYGDEWYASPFRAGKGKVTGEITPAYSILSREDIEHISGLMPEVKLVLMIRNPVDRAWSAIRFRRWRMTRRHRRKGEKAEISPLSIAELESYFEAPEWIQRGDYVRTLNNWRSFFPEEQLFIGFFEDIVHNPERLLIRLFDFLGVDSSQEYVTRLAFEQSNPSPKKKMPLEFRLYLTRRYYPQMKTLSEMLGGYAVLWRQEAEELLSRSVGQ
mgnify:CR=1 FL=1